MDEEDFAFPLYRFLVLACIGENNKFKHVKQIPPIIARLQWCCHAVVYYEIMIRVKSYRNSKVGEELCKYVQINHNTPFNSIRQATSVRNFGGDGGIGLPRPRKMHGLHNREKPMVSTGQTAKISLDSTRSRPIGASSMISNCVFALRRFYAIGRVKLSWGGRGGVGWRVKSSFQTFYAWNVHNN